MTGENDDGSVVLPRVLDVAAFVGARAPEIRTHLISLTRDVAAHATPTGDAHLGFGPRHLRRRTRSHNSYRHRKRPNRTRAHALAATGKGNIRDEEFLHVLPPIRKARRRPERLRARDVDALLRTCPAASPERPPYPSSPSSPSSPPSSPPLLRLPTHSYHAKRMRMTTAWGVRLPDCPYGRGHGSAAVFTSMKRGAVLHDATYYAHVLVWGAHARRVLQHCTHGHKGDLEDECFFEVETRAPAAKETIAATSPSLPSSLSYPSSSSSSSSSSTWRRITVGRGHPARALGPMDVMEVPHEDSLLRGMSVRDPDHMDHLPMYLLRVHRCIYPAVLRLVEDTIGSFPTTVFAPLGHTLASFEVWGSSSCDILRRVLGPKLDLHHDISAPVPVPSTSTSTSTSTRPPSPASGFVYARVAEDPRWVVRETGVPAALRPPRTTQMPTSVEYPGGGHDHDHDHDRDHDLRHRPATLSTSSTPSSSTRVGGDMPWPSDEITALRGQRLWRSLAAGQPAIGRTRDGRLALLPRSRPPRVRPHQVSRPRAEATDMTEIVPARATVFPVWILSHMGEAERDRYTVLLPVAWAAVVFPALVPGTRVVGLREWRWCHTGRGRPLFPWDDPGTDAFIHTAMMGEEGERSFGTTVPVPVRDVGGHWAKSGQGLGVGGQEGKTRGMTAIVQRRRLMSGRHVGDMVHVTAEPVRKGVLGIGSRLVWRGRVGGVVTSAVPRGARTVVGVVMRSVLALEGEGKGRWLAEGKSGELVPVTLTAIRA